MISTLNDEDKSTLQNLMDQIDGVLSTEWTYHCTHLTVSKATLTEKVLLTKFYEMFSTIEFTLIYI